MLRLLVLSLCFFALVSRSAAEGDSVLVIYNSNMPESRALAEFYAEKRSVPEKHLIGVDAPERLTIDRAGYIENIHNSILRTIKERSLMQFLLREEADEFGRLRVNLQSNSIRYMVTMYGVPVHISESEDLDDSAMRAQWFRGNQTASQFENGGLARNEAAVDSELSLLLLSNVPLTGFIPNPLFRNQNFEAHPEVIRVSRLDGPSPANVRQMINRGIEAERKGLRGRAYVDLDQRGGAYALGNDWLRETAGIFEKLGYDTVVDRESALFQSDTRFDAPVLYAGWYAHHMGGVFSLPRFQFAPGAIAVHIHSFSAQNLRQDRRNWCGPLIARGASATLGNTAEPFLGLSHHVNLFFALLADGANLADAAYAALPGLSWQAIVLGDPLYRPFKADLLNQLARVFEDSVDPYDSYVILRAINAALASDDSDRAQALARRSMYIIPSPAVGLRAAQLHLELDEPALARNFLGFSRYFQRFNSMDWMLMSEVAKLLHSLQDTRAAFDLMDRVLSSSGMPARVERSLLNQAIQYADQTGETEKALRFRARLQEIR